MILKRVMIEIKNYQSVEIIEFIESTNIIHEFNGEFALKDICEFILTDNSVTLKGFSKIRGFWTEYVFTSCSLSVGYESAEAYVSEY
jgi:hypothetical protein